MGLLTKLNLLTIGLIFLTAIATTGYYVWQQWRDETGDLRQRGATALAMLAELSEFGLYTNNRAYLEAILESLSAEGDIAYAVIVDRKGDAVAGRRISEALGPAGPPATPADSLAARGRHHVDDGSDDPRAPLRRARRAGRRLEDRHRDGIESGPARAGRRQCRRRLRPRRRPRRRWVTSGSG